MPTFFTSMPEVPSKTFLSLAMRLRAGLYKLRTWTTARLPIMTSCQSTLDAPQELVHLTSSFQDLTRPLGAIRQRQRDDLVESRELDLYLSHLSSSSRQFIG